MEVAIEQSWKEALREEFEKDYFKSLVECLHKEKAEGKVIFPPGRMIFKAFELTPVQNVKVVILGQDPYHEKGQANGLAFSVNPGTPLPPSLKNIFKELTNDLDCPYPTSGDLTPWAEQGVLLLNTVLTVREGEANSHKNWGWQTFTEAVFAACAKLPQPVVFLLWGGQARAFLAGIPLSELPNKVPLCSSHPSPLGATKGNDVVPAFISSRPFSTANYYLKQMGSTPINWTLP